jgi:CHAT domain-containing protein
MTHKIQLQQSLPKVMEAMRLAHISCKHPDPDIGGDELEGHLGRVIPYTYFLLSQFPVGCVDQEGRAAMLHFLCDMFHVRYRRNERPDDLEQALTLAEDAIITLPPGDDCTFKEIIGHLGELQHFKYKQTQSTDDLQRGITWAEQAVAATPPGAPHRYCRVGILSNLLNDRYTRTGAEEDLQQSISLTEENVTASQLSLGQDGLLSMNLLASRLQDRYHLKGALSDLEQATIYAQQVLDRTAEDDPELGIRQSNLANKFHSRYLRTRELDDLQSAIRLAEEAKKADMSESYTTMVYLGLGALFHIKYDQLENMDDLNQSIVCTERAIANMPLADPLRPLCLFNLGNALFAKYQAKNDIEEVIIRNPTDFSDKRLIDLLCTPIGSRHEKLNIGDLDKAIDFYKEGLHSIPIDHVTRARVLLTTGIAVESRYFRTYWLQDLEDAVRFYTEAWNYQIARPLERIEAARRAAQLHALQKDFEGASRCLTGAVRLLPMISPRSLQRDDQQHMLSQFSGLAAETASCALQAGRSAVDTLRLLELCRGVVISFTIDLRSDISTLKTTHPSLFQQFDSLRHEIDSNGLDLESNMGHNYFEKSQSVDSVRWKAVHQRKLEESYQALEAVIAKIRELPGYDEFLLPLKAEEMMRMAQGGAVVVFNSTQLRSDAIIITPSSIRQLKLPALNHEDVTANIDEMNKIFKDSRKSTRGTRNKRMSELLLWLWESAVGPVCDELGLGEQGKAEKPSRIWWIGVGPLNSAPFHAAGDHSPKSLKNVISLVSSSYISTMKALAYARQDAHAQLGTTKARIQLVNMSETPGHKRLAGVEKELLAIQEIARRSSVPTEVFNKPPKGQILQQLRQISGEGEVRIIHFACHGLSDPQNPLESRILLFKDGDTKFEEPAGLSVREVSNMKIQGAYLAYLGACHTANNSVVQLADEGMHVVNSFQLAGFRNVIGNMWKVDDKFCVLVSTGFYRALFENCMHGGTGIDVAEAFHCAMKTVWQTYWRDFIGWIPFVHYGA